MFTDVGRVAAVCATSRAVDSRVGGPERPEQPAAALGNRGVAFHASNAPPATMSFKRRIWRVSDDRAMIVDQSQGRVFGGSMHVDLSTAAAVMRGGPATTAQPPTTDVAYPVQRGPICFWSHQADPTRGAQGRDVRNVNFVRWGWPDRSKTLPLAGWLRTMGCAAMRCRGHARQSPPIRPAIAAGDCFGTVMDGKQCQTARQPRQAWVTRPALPSLPGKSPMVAKWLQFYPAAEEEPHPRARRNAMPRPDRQSACLVS